MFENWKFLAYLRGGKMIVTKDLFLGRKFGKVSNFFINYSNFRHKKLKKTKRKNELQVLYELLIMNNDLFILLTALKLSCC